MNGEPWQRALTTAGLLDPAKSPAKSTSAIDRAVQQPAIENRMTPLNEERPPLARLFAADVASEFRSRWDVIQKRFVNDPRRAVPRWR